MASTDREYTVRVVERDDGFHLSVHHGQELVHAHEPAPTLEVGLADAARAIHSHRSVLLNPPEETGFPSARQGPFVPDGPEEPRPVERLGL